MKKLFILLYFIPIYCISQESLILGFKEDKVNHFTCGYIIGFAGNGMIYELTKNKHIAFISGIGLSILAGHLKENYDRNNNKKYSRNDLYATSIGGLAGSFTVRIIIGKRKHRSLNTMAELFEADNNL